MDVRTLHLVLGVTVREHLPELALPRGHVVLAELVGADLVVRALPSRLATERIFEARSGSAARARELAVQIRTDLLTRTPNPLAQQIDRLHRATERQVAVAALHDGEVLVALAPRPHGGPIAAA